MEIMVGPSGGRFVCCRLKSCTIQIIKCRVDISIAILSEEELAMLVNVAGTLNGGIRVGIENVRDGSTGAKAYLQGGDRCSP